MRASGARRQYTVYSIAGPAPTILPGDPLPPWAGAPHSVWEHSLYRHHNTVTGVTTLTEVVGRNSPSVTRVDGRNSPGVCVYHGLLYATGAYSLL